MKSIPALILSALVFAIPAYAKGNPAQPMQKHLQRISPLLQVADLNKSLEFYTQKLGFKEVWKDGTFVIISRDGCDIFLAQKQVNVDLRNRTARSAVDGFADYDLHIHCLPGAVDALWSEFVKAGVQTMDEGGPVSREYGVRDFGIKDLDGYIIIFGSPIVDAKSEKE